MSAHRRGLPDSLHLNFRVVPSPTTLFDPISAFFALASFRVLGFSLQSRFFSALIRSPGFAFHSQARRRTKPNRVPFVRTDPFAFRCSPPRLTATQLRSAFNQSSVWLRGFSPPFQVRSRAHECGSLLPPSHDPEKGGGKPPHSTAASPRPGAIDSSPRGGEPRLDRGRDGRVVRPSLRTGRADLPHPALQLVVSI